MTHLSHFKQFLPLVLGKATSFQLDNMESVKKGLEKGQYGFISGLLYFFYFPDTFLLSFITSPAAHIIFA